VSTDLRAHLQADLCTDVPADVRTDLQADLPSNVCADMPPDVPPDVHGELRADVPPDVPCDVHGDLRADVPRDAVSGWLPPDRDGALPDHPERRLPDSDHVARLPDAHDRSDHRGKSWDGG
jgi:hypothetical protein